MLNGNTNFAFDNVLYYTTEPTFNNRKQLADKGYVDDVVVGNNPTTSPTVAGTIKTDKVVNALGRTFNVLVQQQGTPGLTLQVLPFKFAGVDQIVDYAGAATST